MCTILELSIFSRPRMQVVKQCLRRGLFDKQLKQNLDKLLSKTVIHYCEPYSGLSTC